MIGSFDSRGRLLVPREVRRQMGIGPGDRAWLELDAEGRLTVEPLRKRLETARGLFADLRVEGQSIVDELLEERRRDAASEDADHWGALVMVLDASALLAVLLDEPGADEVIRLTEGDLAMSAVNWCEVVGTLIDRGSSYDDARTLKNHPIRHSIQVVPFDDDQAQEAAQLRTATRALGLALGDRACLPGVGSQPAEHRRNRRPGMGQAGRL